jgi:O-antigen/teichoic acid export membrane protein
VSAIKKLVGDTAIYGLSSIAGRFINYLLVPLLTRVFTQAEYGANAEFYGYISFLNIILTHGMETTFFRFSQDNNSQKVFANAFLSVFFVSFVFGLSIILFGNQISKLIGYGNNPEFLWYSAGIIITDALTAIPFALLRQQNKALRFALIKNLNIFLNIMVTIYLAWAGPYCKQTYGIVLPFWHEGLGINAVFRANLLASLFTFLLLAKELKLIKIGFDPILWKKMMVYATPMIWVGLAGMVNETLDRVIIKYIWPNAIEAQEMNGIYAANYKLAIIITLFIQAYKYAAEPFFFSLAKQTDKRDLYAQVMNYFAWICMFIFLVVTFFLDFFQTFIGPEFREGLLVVPILLWANIFLGLYYNVSIWYKLSDKTKKGAHISMIGALITIVLNIILIPIYGYVGCAITTLICYFTMMVLGYVWGQKYYPIPYKIVRILTYALVSLSFYFGMLWLQNSFTISGFLYYFIRVLLLFLFFMLAFLLERKSIKNYVK